MQEHHRRLHDGSCSSISHRSPGALRTPRQLQRLGNQAAHNTAAVGYKGLVQTLACWNAGVGMLSWQPGNRQNM